MINLEKIPISKEWLNFLESEFLSDYFIDIKSNYVDARESGEIIYPFSHLIFNAFNITRLNNLKIILLGQDPYHNAREIDLKDVDSGLLPKQLKERNAQNIQKIFLPEAMGLSFSVPRNIKIPPSLRNIYKELNNSIDFNTPSHGNLESWGREGMLLLNSILTVRARAAASHRHFGWERFSDRIISKISLNFKNLIFILLGKFAQNKACLIDKNKHFILKAPHPSPLSHGFNGSDIFKEADKILKSLNIDFKWQL